jgi:membrane protease subunit (stomatin/prohibitin family)
MSSEEEFYKEYYKYFSGDNNNVYQFKNKAEKRLKFGTEGAVFNYSAFDKATMSLNFNFKLSNDFMDKLDRRIDRIQKALEDIRNDLRRSEDF